MKPEDPSRQLRERDARIPPALANKAAFDTARADKPGVGQWKEHRTFCFWCRPAAGSILAMGLSWPRKHAPPRTNLLPGGLREEIGNVRNLDR